MENNALLIGLKSPSNTDIAGEAVPLDLFQLGFLLALFQK